jgi:hypothetical protein
MFAHIKGPVVSEIDDEIGISRERSFSPARVANVKSRVVAGDKAHVVARRTRNVWEFLF